MKKEIEKLADRLVSAYKKNKLISPLPIKYTKNINNATRLRKICESKIKTKIMIEEGRMGGFWMISKPSNVKIKVKRIS